MIYLLVRSGENGCGYSWKLETSENVVLKTILLNGCNTILTAYQHNFDSPELQAEIFAAHKASRFVVFFTATNVKTLWAG